MRTKKFTVRVLAGFTLWAGLAGGNAAAQVKVEDYLGRAPLQAGVLVTTPTGAELAGCRAEQVAWPKIGNITPVGVVVKDGQGKLVRQYIDAKGAGKPNIWSYYYNGVESYREIDSNGNGKVDQYRWLGVNGGKYGLDIDEDGKIDGWVAMSPEELSQEMFQAILTKDAKKLDALLVSEQDLKSFGLPDAEIAKLMARRAGAVKKMMETADALKLTPAAKWIHLELGVGSTTPADSFNGRTDLIKQRSGTALVDKGENKADVFAIGELILVGTVWKAIDGPSFGPAAPEGAATGMGEPLNPEAVKINEEIAKLKTPTNAAEKLAYHTARGAGFEKIVALTVGAAQEPWLKQVIDEYGLAADGGALDSPAMSRLKQWLGSIETNAPKSAAAAYAAFRYASAEYGIRIADPKPDFLKIQSWWREQLEAFVTKYPAGEDAPDAMLRLAVANEFTKDGDAEAKKWYERLAKDYATHPNAARAQGAVKRLTCEGQPFVLAGQTLDGKPFNMNQVQNKAVVVYYWASWGRDAASELKQLGELATAYQAKGLVIVTVSLDDEPAKAVQALNASPVPGAHLHAPGGLDRSPLAVDYGIQMVPHIFVVGKDGKVTNRNAQAGPMLKDEIEKLLK